MNPYEQLVSQYAELARHGRAYPLGRYPRCPRPQPLPDAPKVLLFSPHPDDEVIIGALPLRLLRKSKWHVINVPVTLGSNPARRAERFAELTACCDCIGFGLAPLATSGLEKVNLETRAQEPGRWAQSVSVIADAIAQHLPRVILFPHEADWNRTHIGTHFLVMDALKSLPADFGCYLVETEFWAAMPSPNLMLEVGQQELADLVTALSFHVGEVRRNPYHLALPAWMVDNVRRGAELLGGQGGAAPDFAFATLYRVRRRAGGNLAEGFSGGRLVSANQDPAALFGV